MDSECSTPTRRRFVLGAGAAGAMLLAGCTDSGDDGSGEGGSMTTDGTTDGTTDDDGSDTASTAETTTGDGGSDTPTGPRRVEFRSTADTEVVGALYGTGDTGVVLVPQINLDRESWEPQATALAERGYVALPIDEDPDNRAASALGALRHLRDSAGVSRVVLVGASSGGEAVVRASARADDGEVDGVAALSPGGGDEVADQLQGRKLFVASEDDEDRFVRVTRQLHEGASRPKALQVYDGGAHGQAIFDTAHGGDLRARLFDLVAAVADGGE